MFHPNLPSLRTLLSGITLPKTDEEGGEIIVAVAAPTPAADPSPVWTSRLASLNKLQGDGKTVVIISGMFFSTVYYRIKAVLFFIDKALSQHLEGTWFKPPQEDSCPGCSCFVIFSSLARQYPNSTLEDTIPSFFQIHTKSPFTFIQSFLTHC
jgi:hypothetical protein